MFGNLGSVGQKQHRQAEPKLGKLRWGLGCLEVATRASVPQTEATERLEDDGTRCQRSSTPNLLGPCVVEGVVRFRDVSLICLDALSHTAQQH